MTSPEDTSKSAKALLTVAAVATMALSGCGDNEPAEATKEEEPSTPKHVSTSATTVKAVSTTEPIAVMCLGALTDREQPGCIPLKPFPTTAPTTTTARVRTARVRAKPIDVRPVSPPAPSTTATWRRERRTSGADDTSQGVLRDEPVNGMCRM